MLLVLPYVDLTVTVAKHGNRLSVPEARRTSTVLLANIRPEPQHNTVLRAGININKQRHILKRAQMRAVMRMTALPVFID
ncbi:hypothetical protein TMES_13635 [Thalassospira mesophila]|uniref:Uncharacterized protein n=1 Tax=Thalassospira mesophila TaxID=1293891 RepID=A0A1Y2KZ58_9PROT|nr:hypothetical protein TMES_13635 [Thalassospira mesophila]